MKKIKNKKITKIKYLLSWLIQIIKLSKQIFF